MTSKSGDTNRDRDRAGDQRWGSPSEIVEIARTLMGGIDLDPCSDSHFNKTVVADEYYSLDGREEDGLKLPWNGRVFVNPPGGLVGEFWDKLMSATDSEEVKKFVWVGFSVEQLCLLADRSEVPLDWHTCILRKRLKFTRRDGFTGSPSHGNYITAGGVRWTAFRAAFAGLGSVHRGTIE